MKTLKLILLFSSFTFSALAMEGKLVSLTLRDSGNTISNSEIEKIFSDYQGKIDLVELKNGNIFYDNEIENALIKFKNSSKVQIPSKDLLIGKGSFLKVISGGDGSGGG